MSINISTSRNWNESGFLSSDKVVVLIEPLVSEDSHAGLFTTGNVLEPYAIESLAASAEAHGYGTLVFQEPIEETSELVQRVLTANPLCVGLSVLTHTYERCCKLAGNLKTAAPDLPIVIGGQHPTLLPESVSNPCFDYAVLGEGEVTFCELLDFFAGHGSDSPLDILGLAIRVTGQMLPIITSSRPRIQNLDDLPQAKRFPKFLQRSKSYNLTYPSAAKQTSVAQIGYSRGCRYNCTFCVSPLVWNFAHATTDSNPVTYRSPTSIALELRRLRDEFGVNFVYFTDLTFNDDRRRVHDLCHALIDAGLHEGDESSSDHLSHSIHWFALLKVGLDSDTASLMARAGCSKVGMGIESFDTAIVHSYKKPYRGLDVVQQSLSATDNVGIINRCLLVLGAPEESPESISHTIQCLKQLPVDQLRLAFLTPYPKTPVALKFADKMDTKFAYDLSYYDEDWPILRCNHFTADDLLVQRNRIARKFYTSSEYKERVHKKLERYPWLHDAYAFFFDELRTSSAQLDLGSILLKKEKL